MTVTIAAEDPSTDVATAMLQAYFSDRAITFVGGKYTPKPADPETLRAPQGAFLVAWSDGEPVGCGALRRLAPHRFPVKWNDISLSSLASQVDSFPPEIGEAIVQFVEVPGDPAAVAVLETDPVVNRELRTTCVATMLRAGTAENALPASATATVNCRIFPGETIAESQAELQRVVADPAIAFKVLDDPVESPASELPEEALAALKAVIARRAPGAPVAPYQEAGGTDGLHFRRAGIPTIGVGGLFASPESDYGFHGNDERLPLAEFAAGLDHFHGLISALAGGDDPA